MVRRLGAFLTCPEFLSNLISIHATERCSHTYSSDWHGNLGLYTRGSFTPGRGGGGKSMPEDILGRGGGVKG